MPAVDAVDDGQEKWLWDGFHRLLGQVEAGGKNIACRVRAGTLADARWLSLTANTDPRALRRTNADKNRAVRLALAQHPEYSDRRIANHVGVTHPFVASIRAELVTVTSSEANQLSTVDSSAKRTGSDGKARRMPTAPATHANGQTVPEPPAEPEPLPLDDAGLPIPANLLAALAAREEFDRLILEIRRLERAAHDLAASQGGAAYRSQLTRKSTGDDTFRHYCEHLKNARYRLTWARPFASVCPYCHHEGQTNPRCRACLGQGWVTQEVWDRAQPDYREAAIAARKVVSS